jgi:hypothetical protein
MTVAPWPSGNLVLGHLLNAAGVDDVSQVVVIRHTYQPDWIAIPTDATPERLIAYTRVQSIGGKLPKEPPPLWITFMADGGRRSRFLTAYENHGEVETERTDVKRVYDLRPSEILETLKGRLVVEWSRDTINWAKQGTSAGRFPIVEIADPLSVPFPGFDNVLLTFEQVQELVEDSRYSAWRTALGAVQGIYLIADSSTGKLYVGKADGGERIFGRWTAYARDGHGGNVGLRELAEADAAHRRHFTFSILRVFGPHATTAEIDAAETYYKRALLTRQYGLNRN